MNKIALGSLLTLAALLLFCPTLFAANALPVVTTFTIDPTAVSPIPIKTFIATDSNGTVVGYMVTSNSTKPAANDSLWTPTSDSWRFFTTASYGSVTLYAWAKDNAGGVSNAKTATTNVVAAHNHDAVYVNEGQAGAITTPMIVDGAVTSSKLAMALYTKAEVDAIIGNLSTQVTALQNSMTSANNRINALETELAAVQASPVMQLGPYVSINANTMNNLVGPHIIFSGVNVHVQNGTGATPDPTINNSQPNGLGNLIVGYNETDGNMTIADRAGSHNLVIGSMHKYYSCGGFVSGWYNTLNAPNSSIVGGQSNSIDGYFSSILGGTGNRTAGGICTISGGMNNYAWGDSDSISGGYGNEAVGYASVIGGGRGNVTNGTYTFVGGGKYNTASSEAATVSGGISNSATALGSSVSGGLNRTASGVYNWVGGGLWQDR